MDSGLFEAYYFYARNCWAQGKLEKAAALFRKAMETRPEDYQAPALLSGVYRALGRPLEAQETERKAFGIIQAHLQSNPDDVRALYLGANLLIRIGQRAKGLDWAARALAVNPDDPTILYNVACIQLKAGNLDEGLDLLERAVANGFAQKEWFLHDSDLNPIRDHPRYRALLDKMK